jgi:hypothetical protein
MLPAPTREEIDHRTIKLVVGVIAITLPLLTSFFAKAALTSISASYYEGGWSQSILIGFLFAIASFLLAYNGMSRAEMVASKVAAIAGLGIALFPCKCEEHIELVPYVHGISAAVMFLILTYFCYQFFQRARSKGHAQAKLRAAIYAVCAIVIFVSVVVLAIDRLWDGGFRIPRLTFYGESAGLLAFGISWLTASRVLPVVTRQDERFSPLRAVNPA